MKRVGPRAGEEEPEELMLVGAVLSMYEAGKEVGGVLWVRL